MATYKLKTFTRTRAELEALETLEVAPPARLLVPLVRNLRHINAALDDFDEVLNRLVHEYGKPDGRGGWYVDPENEAALHAFYEEREAALDADVDVDIHPIAMSRFLKAMKDKRNFQVPMRVLTRLDYLIPIDEDVDKFLDNQDTDGV